MPKLSDFDENVLESQLKGKTLLVYWYLIQQPTRTTGIRAVQRALGFSSPSIAVHHLAKLQDLGLVEKQVTGDYVLAEEVKVGILKFFTHLGKFVVPRYLFYSVLFTTMLATYALLFTMGILPVSVYALIFGLVGAAAFWVETFRLWREKPC